MGPPASSEGEASCCSVASLRTTSGSDGSFVRTIRRFRRPALTNSWLLMLLPLALVGCATENSSLTDSSFRAEWEAWHRDRLERLRQPDGWLALAGLYWLDEGEHTVGSDEGSDLVFPPSAPGRVGTLTLADDSVTLRTADGITVLHEGAPVREIVLEDDADDAPTVVEHGSLSWHAIRRSRGLGIRLRDTASPVLRDFEGIETFDYDPAWRIDAQFEASAEGHTLAVPSITGVAEEEPSPGALVFSHDGTEYRLDVTGTPGAAQVFLVFADATSGHETYGGGRFVYVDAPDANGRTVIDFNRAYNPPCIFTPYATCPMPLPQNRLPFRIEAGEKTWGGH